MRGFHVAAGEVLGDAERVEQLEPDPAFLVEGFDDVGLSAARSWQASQRRSRSCGVAVGHLLGLLGEEGGHREDLGIEAEQALDALADEVMIPGVRLPRRGACRPC